MSESGGKRIQPLSLVNMPVTKLPQCKFLPLPPISASFMHTIKAKLDEVLAIPEASTIIAENKSRSLITYYNTLIPDDKTVFLRTLAKDYGVDHSIVLQLSTNIQTIQNRGYSAIMRSEDRLRQALVPRYQQLFTQLSRQEGGVKFLVDLRANVLTLLMSQQSMDEDIAHLHCMNSCLRELLSLWFSVGFMQLERITWESPCDMLQKISEYEAVHPIRNWTDLKRRVGAYRRCFVFTHNSMPREPCVVLHTALSSEISKSIQSIVHDPKSSSPSSTSSDSSPEPPSPTPENTKEENNLITTGIFYSITSTQKGLQGVELGNYLIKNAVKELLSEFPRMHQFSSLSPIPGFKDWLLGEINKQIHSRKIGETPDSSFLLKDEVLEIRANLGKQDHSLYEGLKQVLANNSWYQDAGLVASLERPLMRLCARYLFLEKRRGFALNPVANFHLRNGAEMWRLNWQADTTRRGLDTACGIMVNYRYFLDKTENNSKQYMECQTIAVSEQVLDLVKLSP